MPAIIGLIGALLLLGTSFTTLTMLALESCQHGTADYFYAAFTKVGYLNLVALFLLGVGYKQRGSLTILVVALSLLSMSWVMVRGFLTFQQVNLNGFAPCFGHYLEDGDYGNVVFWYGPYFGFFYLFIIIVLMYLYIVRMDLPIRPKKFNSSK